MPTKGSQARKAMARPERLLRGLRPLVLRCALDRRRCAAASNFACGEVVELPTFWFVVAEMIL
jgi:hypothetical protein